MKPTPPPILPVKRTVVPAEPELSSRAALNIVRIFVVLLIIPLLFEVASWFSASKTNLAAATVRSGMQWVLMHALTEGNRAVFLGREGWLFEQGELDRWAHATRPGNDVKADLIKLAARLKAQDTPLMVVAIPDRITIYPEQIRPGRFLDVVRMKDEAGRLAELKAAGIDVMDMTEALWEFRDRQPVFFPHDSHWTPEAMKGVALAVNRHIQEKFPRLSSTDTPVINATILGHSDAGDLARRLDPLHAAGMMGVETADLVSIQGIEPDENSPIVLHGGELMRVYDDARLSFGGGGDPPNAGFVTQLSTLVGRPLDVRDLPRANESYEDKKLVIILLPMAELVP
ncbi:alginate O-acetyltransferase AlgX-related protein [Prosthecobacter sp.]|uniref:alginate O-acetyltransferase AlgX-related protein n=1 Tax=Prosthecobacter sp. TaxID=1965333 RepID=UPI00378449A5